MWYKNIAGRFLGLVTKRACDRKTDRITIPKTALAQLHRTAKIKQPGARSLAQAPGRHAVHCLSPDASRQAAQGNYTNSLPCYQDGSAHQFFKMQKGYYFQCSRRTNRTDDEQ